MGHFSRQKNLKKRRVLTLDDNSIRGFEPTTRQKTDLFQNFRKIALRNLNEILFLVEMAWGSFI
jgi:hypothetical protein